MTVKIICLNDNGEGVFLDEKGKKCSVPFVLPNEEALVYKPKRSRNYFLDSIVTESVERVAPICSHFAFCGGCTLQHLKKIQYKELKEQKVINILNENDLSPKIVEKLVECEFGKRRRANMEAIKRHDETFLGFHRFKSHKIFNLRECPALSMKLSQLLPSLREVLNDVLENKQNAKIFLLDSDTGIDIALEIIKVKELTDDAEKKLKNWAENSGISRLWFRHRKISKILFFKNPIQVCFSNSSIDVDAYSFLQPSKESEKKLVSIVESAVKDQSLNEQFKNTKEHLIFDLFSGSGTFSIPLSKFGKVIAFENDNKAINALGNAIEKDSLSIAINDRDLFESPVLFDEFNDCDVVIIDPPRAGAEKQIEQLVESGVSLIIYISCCIESFARDAKILCKKYCFEKITPVDQFVFSSHIEIVGVFKKICMP